MNTTVAGSAAGTEHHVPLPTALWQAMKPRLNKSIEKIGKQSPQQKDMVIRFGSRVSLRLIDGTVKQEVTINWDGLVVDEWYEEFGVRAEVYRQPRFKTEDIESWGYFKGFWFPTWTNWFRRSRRWHVLVYSNGKPGPDAA